MATQGKKAGRGSQGQQGDSRLALFHRTKGVKWHKSTWGFKGWFNIDDDSMAPKFRRGYDVGFRNMRMAEMLHGQNIPVVVAVRRGRTTEILCRLYTMREYAPKDFGSSKIVLACPNGHKTRLTMKNVEWIKRVHMFLVPERLLRTGTAG